MSPKKVSLLYQHIPIMFQFGISIRAETTYRLIQNLRSPRPLLVCFLCAEITGNFLKLSYQQANMVEVPRNINESPPPLYIYIHLTHGGIFDSRQSLRFLGSSGPKSFSTSEYPGLPMWVYFRVFWGVGKGWWWKNAFKKNKKICKQTCKKEKETQKPRICICFDSPLELKWSAKSIPGSAHSFHLCLVGNCFLLIEMAKRSSPFSRRKHASKK